MELSSQALDELRAAVHRLCGLVIPRAKAYLIRHRLAPVARAAGCRTFAELAGQLRSGDALLHASVIEAITTKETAFFRDGHPFEAFRQHALPALVEAARARGTRLRLWSAACATGQEAYSLAMLLDEYAAAHGRQGVKDVDFAVLATDVSQQALEVARAGVYSEREAARGLTAAQRARHFRPCAGGYAVCDGLRRLVEFRRVNLIEPLAGLGPFDAIFARNVLIYFDDSTRRRLCEQFHTLLVAGGVLVIGSAESLYGVTERFETCRYGPSTLYRKRPSP